MSLPPKIKWNKNPSQVNSTMTRYTDRALYAIAEALQKTSKDSAQWIVDAKIKRGSRTGTLWHDVTNKERGNEPGARVETGEMMRSVGSTPTMEQGRGLYSSEFGLRLPSAGGRKYFIEQDEGFDLELYSGETKFVPGMNTFAAVLPALRTTLRMELSSRGFKLGKMAGGGRSAARDPGGFSSASSEVDQLINRDIALRRYQAMSKQDAARNIKEATYKGSIIEQFGSFGDYNNRFGGK